MMEVRRDLYNLDMFAKLMVLLRQIMFKSGHCWGNVMWIFAEKVPPLHRVAPRNLEPVTSYNWWPFLVISALMLFLVLIILLVSVLTSIPYALALSTDLLVRTWSSQLLPPIRSISSANRRLQIGVLIMETSVWWSWDVSCMNFSGTKMDRKG